MKKIIYFLFIACFLGASAQTGSWKVIPMSGPTIDQVQDTPTKVYFLSGGSLYSYDKATSETEYYTPGQRISDSGISFMRYNPDKRYVALAYANGNIDLVYDDGRVVNLPEIKNSNISSSKTINSLQPGRDRLYAATSFGIVVYDDNGHYVAESGVYNEDVPEIVELGDILGIWRKDVDGEYKFAYSPKADRHNTIDKFVIVGRASDKSVTAVDDDTFLTMDNGVVNKVRFDASARRLEVSELAKVPGGKQIERWSDGWYVAGSDGFHIINAAADAANRTAYPSEFAGRALSFWDSPSEFWAADSEGIGSYSLNNGAAQIVISKFFPESSRQPRSYRAELSPDGSQVTISECAISHFFPKEVATDVNFRDAPLLHEIYDWSTGEIIPNYVRNAGGDIALGGTGRVLYDPEDPEYQYVGNLFNGLYVMRDGEFVCKFDQTNSPLDSRWGSLVYDLAFDSQGNLWLMMYIINSNPVAGSKASPVKILTKQSLDMIKQGKFDQMTWLQPDWVGTQLGETDAKIIFSSRADKGLVASGGWSKPLVGIDTKGTTRIDDDAMWAYSGLLDQDGALTTPTFYTWMVEDRNGWIWLGTDFGVFVVKDVKQIADKSSVYLEVVRPKVARNDGTNYADYLLSSDVIIGIAVDANNRKWIATSTSGVYCVSADGTEILEHFDKTNSPLLSNAVTMVACDPHGNDVLIGTSAGMYVYASSSAPPSDDYSNIYAYPNPVRPDYSGPITITGLMDDSLVKIADAHGNVVWSGRSEGGMAVWDGCDSAGRRVRTGVYMVMASQNTNGTSGAVAKIMVVN